MSGGCPDNHKMRASNFATIFAATGSLGPRRPMGSCPHLIIRPGAFRISVRCLGGAPVTRHGVNREILTQNTCFGPPKRPPVRAFWQNGKNESARTDETTQGTRLSRLVQPNSRVTEQKQSKTHGPITSSDQTVPTQIRACAWSMLFAFALLCNTLTHFFNRILPDRNSTWDRQSGPRPADRHTL
jgi:hypothetical protein